MLGWFGEPALAGEEGEEGVEHGSAAELAEFVEVEGEGAGGLAVWGVEEADVASIGEDADGDASVAKEALEFCGGGIAPVFVVVGRVEASTDSVWAEARVGVGEVPDEGEVVTASEGGFFDAEWTMDPAYAEVF